MTATTPSEPKVDRIDFSCRLPLLVLFISAGVWLVIGTFLRRPPPELRVAPLETEAILRLAAALPRALAGGPRAPARARAA